MSYFKKKIISIVIIFSIIMNLIPNFGLLTVVNASSNGKERIILEIDENFGIQTVDNNRVFAMKINLNNITEDQTVNALFFTIKFDQNKIAPATKTSTGYKSTNSIDEFSVIIIDSFKLISALFIVLFFLSF